ncbi:MAG: stage 0 sporulation family protein [Candidatus Hydrogenedentes bacterium]|nr:stage 0 sporulation family protein [Candidatus Hydrogenedentota bacterium]
MNIAQIRLRKPRRVLSFLCDGIALDRDESCIVESGQGLEWGTCVLPPEPCSDEIAKRMSVHVIRKAGEDDLNSYMELEQEEKKAQAVCQEHIDKRSLPMKLVDTEYTFDRHKITFFFTAENRVDFRELVRELARELHSRIELRHIQVRDRSKVIGGLGCCGRVLCCTSWLDEFVPISMRMAKCQNLSLNPGKISGQCGRLLCCLSYENELYKKGELGRRRPVQREGNTCCANNAAQGNEKNCSDSNPPIVVEAPEKKEEVSKDAVPRPPRNKRRNRNNKKNTKGNPS